jgi:quercetin dioxygenase-like cupin family protein
VKQLAVLSRDEGRRAELGRSSTIGAQGNILNRRFRPTRDVGLLLVGAIIAAASLAVLDRHPTSGLAGIGDPAGGAIRAQAADIGGGALPERAATTVKAIACEKLPNVPGKSITTAIVTFPPGAYSPRHRHPGSVTAFVLKGTLRSQLEGGPVETYSVGQTWFEPPGTIHLFAENASSTAVAALLATFIADDDCGPLTIPD